MGQHRHHYEQAFSAYLRSRRIPFVSVNEARKSLLPLGMPARAGRDDDRLPALKSFDFVIYGQGGNLLAEVKGRRTCGTRLECWVTREDVESLLAWEHLFGHGFDAAFVFAYWFEGQPPDALFQEVFEHDGRWYALRSVLVREYAGAMKTRSARWGTIDLPRHAFERLSAPFSAPASRLAVGDTPPLLEALA